MSQPTATQIAAETQDATPQAHEGEHGVTCRPGMMECPVCGSEMPDLKGGKATICPSCGFKDSCCY